MEIKDANEEQQKQYQEWFNEQFTEAEIKDKRVFSLPLVGWKAPTSITAAEKYQVCCIAFAILLSTGVTTEELESASNSSGLWEGHSFDYTFEEDDARSSLTLLKCQCLGKDTGIDNAMKDQVIRLVLSLLKMFSIPVSYFIQMQKAAV